jgi:hypothetical protein
MATAAAEVKKVGIGELRAYISDRAELTKGTTIFDSGQLSNLARYQNKLFCEAKGSGASPYKVTLTYKDAPSEFKAQCSCPARKFGERAGFCKHAAALLVAWARAPESFAVSEGPIGGVSATGEAKKKDVKKGKISAADLMKTGVDQVSTLVRELGVSGVASLSGDRVEQIQTLGQTLRENKLRRLSARALELAQILGAPAPGGQGVLPVGYTSLMADLLLTARKLEKHLGGEPLDDRHVEELVGKTWRKEDRKAIKDLDLVEYAFSTWTTSDDYIIRESRFLDVASGHHYSEKQIVPAFLRRTEPKPSRSGHLLAGARGTTFPGYPPYRIDFDDLGDKRHVGPEVLSMMIEKSLPDVGAALAALQEHRKDVFAPDMLPIALRVDTLFARGARLQAVDEKGHALHLPFDKTLEEQLGGSLHNARLRAILGSVGIDAALPTLWPAAAIIEGPLGLELRALPDVGIAGKRSPVEGAAWGAAAREAGASGAAITLGEVREELADAFLTGLAGLTPRVTDTLATRLRELGLEKQAALLQSLTAKPDPADRLDDFIKLYQVLEIALVRLAGATHVDRNAIERVPTYESVFVARREETLPPKEVTLRRARGEINRYESAVHYARYYSEIPPEELAIHVFPIWADGTAAPYVAEAFATRRSEAIRAAEKALTIKAGRVAKMTAIRVLQTIGGREADGMLWDIMRTSKDAGLRAMARDALDTLESTKAGGDIVRRRRASDLEKVQELAKEMLSAPTLQERKNALRELEMLGHRAAIPSIRQAFWSDASREVRHEAAHALAHLGDTDMVETFLGMLVSRGESEQEAKVAALALGHLGDVRGLNELLYAYAEGYKPAIVGEAIKMFGSVALDPLLDLIEAQPEIAKRAAALDVLRQVDDKELSDALLARLEARRGQADVGVKAQLYLKLAEVHHFAKRNVASAIHQMLGNSQLKEEVAAARAARKALGL